MELHFTKFRAITRLVEGVCFGCLLLLTDVVQKFVCLLSAVSLRLCLVVSIHLECRLDFSHFSGLHHVLRGSGRISWWISH